jgi:serine/threonine protein kinase
MSGCLKLLVQVLIP